MSRYISASALTTYLKCPRSALLSALGLRSGSTPAQARGTALHAALEDYLNGVTPTVEDDLGDLARTNGYLPRPGSDIYVELGLGEANADAARYAVTTTWTGTPIEVAGRPFRGIVDLVRLDRGQLEIWDHKTTSGWYWAETDETLPGNLQLWAYAEQVCRWLEAEDRLPPGDIIMGHLQYRKTKSPRPDDVRNSVQFATTRFEVARKWKLIEDVAAAYSADLDRALTDTRADKGHCGAYGGCDYAPFCHLVPHRDVLPEGVKAIQRWTLDF